MVQRGRLVFPALVFGVASLAGGQDGSSAPQATAASTSAVVLELFTSQGCSSCPAAERVLSTLGASDSLRSRIIPLAFHVDYWNEGGWIDPFSAREWTLRQAVYNQALGLDDAYTPQLVVNGQTQFLGSDGQRAIREITADLEKRPSAAIGLSARRDEGQKVRVDVTAEMTESVNARRLDLLVALFESGLVTPVAHGENKGSTLKNDYIVHRLEAAFSLGSKAGARRERQLSLKLDPTWKLENVGVAAFLQDPTTMRIYGAAPPQFLR